MAWTEDRVATLSKLWADGLSASQIAKQLGGVTRNAVIGKVHRLGLSGRAKPSRPKPAKVQSAPRTTPRPKPARTAAKMASSAKAKAASASLPVSTEPPLEAKAFKDGSYATILTLTDHMCANFRLATRRPTNFGSVVARRIRMNPIARPIPWWPISHRAGAIHLVR